MQIIDKEWNKLKGILSGRGLYLELRLNFLMVWTNLNLKLIIIIFEVTIKFSNGVNEFESQTNYYYFWSYD
jgi:hypothetical protein